MDDEDDVPAQPFEGTVRRSHAMEPGTVVLVLERYAGDIEVGDVVIVVSGETRARAAVVTLAWGSSFGYESPPLTLVVSGLDGDASYVGAALQSADEA